MKVELYSNMFSKEQYGTTIPKMSKYMFEANQSLRFNFEKLVWTVHVVLQVNLL